MTDPADYRTLYRLMSWMSPSFPVGAYTYSHGLESVVEEGTVSDLDSLTAWLKDILRFGAGWTDGLLLRRAWSGQEALADVNALALALSPTRERRLETAAQGGAFLKTARDAWPVVAAGSDGQALDGEVAYPIAVGHVARAHGLPLAPVLHAYLHGFAANLISAGVRLIPLGQTDGQRGMVALEATIEALSRDLQTAPPEDLGGIAYAADIASANHETLYSRLFRS